MLWTPQNDCRRIITNAGIVGTTVTGTAVPENAVANNYGALTEVISSAANDQDSWGIAIAITGTGATAAASEATCDILIGGATDDMLIKALICGYRPLGATFAYYYFPLHIPSGKRIAAQISSARTGITDPTVAVWLFGGGTPPHRVGRKVTTYGTQINNSRGQAVTPTASGGAASVTQMTASSTEDHFYFMPGFQAATDTTLTPAGNISIGIGVGAATEARLNPSWWFGKNTDEVMCGPFPHDGAWCEIPSGTRLTLLASNSGGNDGAYDGLIYAVS